MSGLAERCAESRLAHGWRLEAAPELPRDLITGYVRPAIRAVPSALARRLKPCRIRLVTRLEDPEASSRWVETAEQIEIAVACQDMEAHDAALEVLLCLGQVLWEALDPRETAAYLVLLNREIAEGITGEIDEEALEKKRRLMAGRASARSRRRLEDYARASFAGTTAEYIHSLWHDVTVREGPDCLPPACVRRRLELLSRWFPPDRGQRLFAPTQE